STYSNHDNDTNRTLTCNDRKTVWAWCYGAPCVVDETDATKATCTCPVMQSPMSTLGGNCREDACDGVWSAAITPLNKVAHEPSSATSREKAPAARVNPPAAACPAG